MKLLADENFPKLIVDELRAAGHDVLWVAADCPKWDDPAILQRAELEARTILTLDKDFLQIALQKRPPIEHAGVVLFRVHPATAARLRPLVERCLATSRPFTGHVYVVTQSAIQSVPLSRSK